MSGGGSGLPDVRKEWLAQASHEMRTPLTVIRSHAELLREKQESLMGRPDEMREIIEALASSSLQLQERLEELLDLLKLEFAAPEPRWEEMDPAELMEEEAGGLAGQAGRVVRVVREGESFRVYGDPFRLRRALRYLLEYTARVATEGGEPEVRLSAGGDGWGIDLVAGRPERGMGLHLYYASRVVEALGGRLRLEQPGY